MYVFVEHYFHCFFGFLTARDFEQCYLMYFVVFQIQTAGLVLLPTRELASQVAEVLQHFLPASLSLQLLIGGAEVAADVQAINTNG